MNQCCPITFSLQKKSSQKPQKVLGSQANTENIKSMFYLNELWIISKLNLLLLEEDGYVYNNLNKIANFLLGHNTTTIPVFFLLFLLLPPFYQF